MESEQTPNLEQPESQPELSSESPLPLAPHETQQRILVVVLLLLVALVTVLGYLVYERLDARGTSEIMEEDLSQPLSDEDLALIAGEELDEEEVEETPANDPYLDPPLFFTTMTHLEGGWDMATESEGFFNRQAGYLRQAYDYAQEYDAVLTIESEVPMAEAMVIWGDNLLQEALDAGQGIGTHCDITPSARFTDAEMIEEISLRKAAVDVLVDPSENLGCAGAGGYGDWYEGMIGAGFKYIDGLVGFHYLAMHERELPEGWDHRSIMNEYYHDHAPQEADLRYYPFRISEVGFTPDDEGELVVSAGDVGQIKAIEESLRTGAWDGNCEGGCEFNEEDVDELVEFIRDFNQTRDGLRVAKLQVYIPTEVFDDPMIEYFFAQMQMLQNEKVMQWASQKEVYEAFVTWEAR
ncbi:MAG: hypothetical protein P8J32_06510 [bacterium]|jgi:hypothetical protein|nr:hypothetical protein [bacterium]